MRSRKLITGILLAVMTIGLFGGIFIARAVTVTPVKAGFIVWTVLNPIPKAVSNDTRQLYVLIVPQVSYGTAPYEVTVTIGVNGGPDDVYAFLTQQSSGTMAPVLWSESAIHQPTTLHIVVTVADNSTIPGFSSPSTTLHLPAY